MSEPFLAELRPFASNVIPKGWAACEGQLLAINQNQALFALLGTTYGGNGTSNFALPDLRGRAAVGAGSPPAATPVALGEAGGLEAVTLTSDQAAHTHLVAAEATTSSPLGALPANGGAYADSHDGTAGSVGGGQAHENRSPYLAVRWCIALQGIFPSQN